nr:Chain B, substrate RT-RH [Human immunodeficiency virus 1]4EQJ_G Chain G, substrate RT-RH [Human immunodeficiency virus 1]
AETFYVDG